MDCKEKVIQFRNAYNLKYDNAIICTGSSPRRIKLPRTLELSNLFYLRSSEDSRQIEHASTSDSHAVIIGGSFVALEVASCLSIQCKTVTVVIRSSCPFRFLGPQVGVAIQRFHESKGVRFVTNMEVMHFEESDGKVQAVVLRDGSKLTADLVVVGIGAVPCTKFITGVERGMEGSLQVDKHMKVVGANDLWAAGDVCVFPSVISVPVRVEHWKCAVQQGKTAAHSIMGENVDFEIGHIFWSVQYGRNLRFAGPGVYEFDSIFFDGKPSTLKFVAYYVHKFKIVAVLSCSRDPVASAASELFKLGQVPSWERRFASNPSEATSRILAHFHLSSSACDENAPPDYTLFKVGYGC